MDAILQFLIDWGYWGLFLGSFIAGSVLPFSSEAVLAACVGPLGLDPVISIAAATAGNVALIKLWDKTRQKNRYLWKEKFSWKKKHT